MPQETPIRSKVDQVAARLRDLIRTGQYAPGARLPPERDLARLYGVSHPTLNKAMTALEAECLIERSVSRGTHVRRDLPAGKVLLVMNAHLLDQGGPYYRAVLTKIRDEVLARGLSPQCVIAWDETPETCATSLAFDAPSRRDARAVVVVNGSQDLCRVVGSVGLPLVQVGLSRDRQLSVSLDYRSLMVQGVARLAARGSRRPALVSHEGWNSKSGMAEFFVEGLQAAGLPTDRPLIIARPLGVMGGLEAARDLASSLNSADGVMVGDENLIAGLCVGLDAAGVSLPIVSHATPGVTGSPDRRVDLIGFEPTDVGSAVVSLLDRALIEGCGVHECRSVLPVFHSH